MNTNLAKYLSDVLRNEAQPHDAKESNQHKSRIPNLNDSKVNQFVLDRKYALRLDEII